MTFDVKVDFVRVILTKTQFSAVEFNLTIYRYI